MGVLTLGLFTTGWAAAAVEDRSENAAGQAMLAAVADPPTVPVAAQATNEQSAEVDSEQSSERSGWAIAAVAIFLGITAIGFVIAVYGYSEGK